MKPDCYKCKFRGTIPGDAHSCCNHSDTVGIMPLQEAVNNLNIKANYHGIVNGWFNWPWNFDPTWLENCDGFEEVENESSQP